MKKLRDLVEDKLKQAQDEKRIERGEYFYHKKKLARSKFSHPHDDRMYDAMFGYLEARKKIKALTKK
jgi:hypothetical protein